MAQAAPAVNRNACLESDSDDDVPLLQRQAAGLKAPAQPAAAGQQRGPAGNGAAGALHKVELQAKPVPSANSAALPWPAKQPAAATKPAAPAAASTAQVQPTAKTAQAAAAGAGAPQTAKLQAQPMTKSTKPTLAGAGASHAPKPAAAAQKATAAVKAVPRAEAGRATNGPATNGTAKRPAPAPDASSSEESESEDDVPLGKRMPAPKPAAKKAKVAPATNHKAAVPKRKRQADSSDEDDSSDDSADEDAQRSQPKRRARNASTPARTRRSGSEGAGGRKSKENGEVKWKTLNHAGVQFPPEYERHNVRMLYDGQPVELSKEQEEVATMAAIMIETDYWKKPTFLRNFWEAFKPILGKNHIIKDMKKCDFRPIYEHLMMEREKKKALSKEEKQALKAEKERVDAKFKTAMVDGRKETVGNFRVEPPGLFRGRGEHPKMGKVKRRIFPRDITINIGEGVPVPEHPYPGQHWKEIRHDKTVTWLAFWKDPISDKQYKYVWLGANSAFKSNSDLEKYEKARKLKGVIDSIRRSYEGDWDSRDLQVQQMAVAIYWIDKLALRAGHEKEEDEADTVGCASLKVGNVECLEDEQIKFDFLGKDSIRYENTVRVHPRVWKLVKQWCKKDGEGKAKRPTDDLFETMDANDLNRRMKEFMDDLSVKVFRTYNASITLDRLLRGPAMGEHVDAKKATYDLANKEVAVLCNHQKSVSKSHANVMEKLSEKMLKLNNEREAIQHELSDARKGSKDTVKLQNKLDRKLEQISKEQLRAKSREDLKTVALGTSKINYLDPRISVAWCKRNEVPMEKVFNKSLLSKFFWAMDVDPDFEF